jgi:hypothetical protein
MTHSRGVITALLKYLLERNDVVTVVAPSLRFKRSLTLWTAVREPSALGIYLAEIARVYHSSVGCHNLLNIAGLRRASE